MLIPLAVAASIGFTIAGPSSWYGGPCDPGDNNIPKWAPGDHNSTPGVALMTDGTAKRTFLLRGPNRRLVVVWHSDRGPNPRTGKVMDLNYTAVMALGYSGPCSYSSYPTGAWAYLRPLNRRGASWWAAKTRTTRDDRWIVRRWVVFKTKQDARKKALRKKHSLR